MPKRATGKRKRKQTKREENPIVRNSFTLPRSELKALTELVEDLRFNPDAKPRFNKSEIVRVGLHLANAAEVAELLEIRNRLGVLKVGRRTKTTRTD